MSVGELLYDLVRVENPTLMPIVWYRHKELTEKHKLMITLENYKANVFPDSLISLINNPNSNFLYYLNPDKIFFCDSKVMQLALQDEVAKVKVDYSIMLDTNYTSYIEKFLENHNRPNFKDENTYITFNALLKNNFNYDYTFYLIENYYNLFAAGEENYTTKNTNHIKLYNNLLNVELFKSINHPLYLQNGRIEFLITEDEAKQNADLIIERIFSDKNKEMLSMFIDYHRTMTLLLIGIWKIQFSSNQSAKNKMKKLFMFIEEKVGIFFERELVLAYNYFEKYSSVSLLNTINKGKTPKNLMKKIQNIAWDFLVPRIMEIQINVHKDHTYFVPFLLTGDKNLKELMRQFRIKGFLVAEHTNSFIPFSDLATTKFFEDKGLKDVLENLKTEEVLEKRNRVRIHNEKYISQVILEEFNELANLLNYYE